MAKNTTTKSKGKTKSAASTGPSKREALAERDTELTGQVVEMRSGDSPSKWHEIGEKLNITPGKAQFLLMVTEVKPKDRIKGQTDEELAKGIINARDDKDLSWGQIAARAGTPEGRVKRLYEEHGKNSSSGTRVSRGGGKAQVKASTNGKTKAASAKGKGKTKKASAEGKARGSKQRQAAS